jgi:glyceraldehyde-3-phosphate dehydrogenase (NADP+)
MLIGIALQDADLDLTAKNIIKGGYSYSGQRCTAVKLVLAHEAIADKLVEKVCGLLSQLGRDLSVASIPDLLHEH